LGFANKGSNSTAMEKSSKENGKRMSSAVVKKDRDNN